MALAYVAGKVSVSSVVGAAVIVAGLQLQATSIPVILVARKALGPLMVIIGLMLAGAWRPRVTLGQTLSVPLLVVAALLGAGVGAAHRIVGGVRRWDRPVRWIAAVILILAGLHDTAVYWLL
jgi:sulfite exporter TauE/SafE